MPVANPNGIRYVQRQHTTDTDKTNGQASSVGVYLATVKDNKDPQRMGRLKVWVPDFGGDPEDEDRWLTVSYASPFAGSTSIFEMGSNVTKYEDTIKSYGMWFSQPDIDSRVLVTFASGRLDLGYWFACLYQTGTVAPVPGLPSGKVHSGDNKVRTNKNRKDTDGDLDKKVEHTLQQQLEQQGLDKDLLRGLTSSGGGRESPSRVTGILTPGQHQFIMDDGDKEGNSSNIRFRTASGSQLLLDDTVGHVYVISKNGKNWIEMSVDGRIHIYGEDDVSIHSEQNINMYAGKSINMQAVDSVNIRGAQTSSVYDASGLNTVVKGDLRESVSGEASTKVVGMYLETAAVIHMNGPIPPDAKDPQLYSLLANTLVTEAIMPVVPEHEPWAGHTGSIVPKGPGTRQMKNDPAPQQVPVEPTPSDKGVPITESQEQDPVKSTPIPVEESKASPEVVDAIRDQNEFRGYPYEDGDGTSIGYGSPVDESAPSTQTFDDGSTITTNEDGTITSTQSQYESLTGTEVNPTNAQQQDADEYAKKKEQELNAEKQKQRAQAEQIFGKDTLTSIEQLAGNANSRYGGMSASIDAKINSLGDPNAPPYTGDDPIVRQRLGLPVTPEMKAAIPGRNSITDENIYNGISKGRADQLLAQDISRSEKSVRSMLTGAGVTNIAPKQFDGLVSMHNQLGDASYSYVGNKKINLTSLYANGEWNRAAGLIAADERDRPRRQQEANIMVNGNYGNPRTAEQVVNAGLNKTNMLYQSGRLNEQTAKTSGYIQQQAAANSWLINKGFNLPGLNFSQRLATSNNIATPIIPGKWAY
jgi:GH24 family phage-related lysozyme (muramidase)